LKRVRVDVAPIHHNRTLRTDVSHTLVLAESSIAATAGGMG